MSCVYTSYIYIYRVYHVFIKSIPRLYISKKNNIQENKKRKKYKYNVNDKVLVKEPRNLKYGTDAYSGPFRVIKVNSNGTVTLKKGCIEDVYNIHNIKPYYN